LQFRTVVSDSMFMTIVFQLQFIDLYLFCICLCSSGRDEIITAEIYVSFVVVVVAVSSCFRLGGWVQSSSSVFMVGSICIVRLEASHKLDSSRPDSKKRFIKTFLAVQKKKDSSRPDSAYFCSKELGM
jgi:hypothetical protein